MKLFYCSDGREYGAYLVVAAEDIEDCEKKVRSYAEPEVLKAVDGWTEPNENVIENTRDFVEKVIANKKNWQECPYGMFSGEWN